MTCYAATARGRASLAFLACTSLAFPLTRPAAAAPTTTSFDLTGSVDRPATYALADLQALPAVTEAVTYGTGNGSVSAPTPARCCSRCCPPPGLRLERARRTARCATWWSPLAATVTSLPSHSESWTRASAVARPGRISSRIK